ncbi:ClpX C4-type zinc finger protein [Amycolatopsis sp. ATCC 39116]|uniref:ClpX C4-type zinc finger protein n=1 Tax=Amycolatopsis sp. (strain ATCC 39116 / 75iv2) TaxID=385957 RepID=UPI0002FC7FC2|nr:ClpX C4-type zinc finger protein [Amycolatopsis sp. ATCC 39116]
MIGTEEGPGAITSKSWRIRKKPTAPERGKFWCHFCGKSRDQVNRLVAADSGVCICDECVMLSLEIILEGEPGDVPGIENITGGGSIGTACAASSTSSKPSCGTSAATWGRRRAARGTPQ